MDEVIGTTKSSVLSNATNTTEASNGLTPGGVAAIVISVLVLIIAIVIGGYFGYLRLKEQRRNHGEYRPQFEEYQHAKNLPYIQPPAIEGLI
ncbi:unnamed protein product [Thelazia callipaeda]|uniref:4.1m domain-containing protein n=1 Tax=Thelazia callipaeda TaxID=103827 RepID=A0A0N5CZW7_THECL|nr:unnamed protein product [Thelazia callipaeda]